MSLKAFLLACALISSAYAQLQPAAVVIPKIETVTLRPDTPATLNLTPGYVSAVRLPEAVSSIAVGDPSAFRAEHSEAEPRMIFFKPLSGESVRSNALIVTTSGKAIALSLVSDRRPGAGAEINYLLDLRFPGALVVAATPAAESATLASAHDGVTQSKPWTEERLDQEIRLQASVPIPEPSTATMEAVVGHSRQVKGETLITFSVRNDSIQSLELLSPQVDLVLRHRGGTHHLASDPVPISEYRWSRRRLEPGERADGVVVFERPASKPADGVLQLRLASAGEADRPVALTLPFIPQVSEDAP